MAITTTREIADNSIMVEDRTSRERSTASFRSMTAGISMEASDWRKISRAICFVDGMTENLLIEKATTANVTVS